MFCFVFYITGAYGMYLLLVGILPPLLSAYTAIITVIICLIIFYTSLFYFFIYLFNRNCNDNDMELPQIHIFKLS